MNIEYNIVESSSVDYKNILHNINIFSFFYDSNPTFFHQSTSNVLSDNKVYQRLTLKNINNVKLDNYFLEVYIEKTACGDDKVKYVINNKTLDSNNIQFIYFTIQVQHCKPDIEKNMGPHHKIIIDYKIDNDMYPTFMVSIFNKMIQKMFSNFYDSLCYNIEEKRHSILC